MSFEIRAFSDFASVPSEIYASFRQLHVDLFSEKYTAGLEEEAANKRKFLLLLALSSENEVLGFKLGYRLNSIEFYSWTGGVHPKARQRGIASALMEKQHLICRENGIQRVQTKTKNQWRHMLILNLKTGFDITSTYSNKKGETVILLEKRL